MNKLTPTLLVLAVLLFNAGEGWSADLKRGVDAYKNKDYATALLEFRPLAEQGDADAQYYLGWMYEKGLGVPRNHKMAKKWYGLAPFKGDFRKGSDAYQRKDYTTALEEWEPLAKQGNAVAQFNLGTMYEDGKGVSQDYKAAIKWYRLAAEKGDPYAQSNLGLIYQQGLVVPHDYQTAVKWLTLSAAQGHASAQSNLGTLYAKGYGVLQDDARALMWYKISASSGKSVNASKNGDLLAKIMTPSQIKKAQGLVQECVRKKFKEC